MLHNSEFNGHTLQQERLEKGNLIKNIQTIIDNNIKYLTQTLFTNIKQYQSNKELKWFNRDYIILFKQYYSQQEK